MLELDRLQLIDSLGGTAAVAAMTSEAKADALEDALAATIQKPAFPTVAEVEALVPTRTYRRGVGFIFSAQAGNPVGKPISATATVPSLPPMPDRPTLIDFIRLRFRQTLNHCLQSANHAKRAGADEEIILACLIHDHPQILMRTDHGHWGGQLYDPYVAPRVAFAVRHHATLRFFPDAAVGYSYPDLYKRLFGEDYVPPPHVQAEYEMVRRHEYYEAARAVTVHDLYAFDPNVTVAEDAFDDVIARHFRDPPEGLGYDGSPAAHLWRSIARPDQPL